MRAATIVLWMEQQQQSKNLDWKVQKATAELREQAEQQRTMEEDRKTLHDLRRRLDANQKTLDEITKIQDATRRLLEDDERQRAGRSDRM